MGGRVLVSSPLSTEPEPASAHWRSRLPSTYHPTQLTPPDHPMQPTLDLPSLSCQLPSHPVLYQLPTQPLNSGSLHLIPTSLDHVSPLPRAPITLRVKPRLYNVA